MFTIRKREMQTAVAGACVLASGGGGSYQVARELIEQGIPNSSKVTLVGLEELSHQPAGWLAASANMGAPDALFQTANPHAPAHAVQALEAELQRMSEDRRFAHFPERGFSWVLPIEVGAINVASPLTVAAQLGPPGREGGLPLIDADAAGRSIPTLSLTVFAANGIAISPAVVASEGLHQGAWRTATKRYNSAVVWVDDETAAEDAIIGLVNTVPFGGIAGLAIYPMTAAELLSRTPPVAGTLSLALEIGHVLESSSGELRAERVAERIRDAGRASEVIWHGRVREVVQAEGGVDVGRIVLEDATGSDVLFTIYNENENVYAMRSDRDTPCVLGPDSICYVTAGDDPLAIDNSDLNRLYAKAPRTRLELFVLAVEAAPQMRERVIIDNFAAVNRALGYAGAYRPWPPTLAAS